jgi:hypothetical protein
MSGRLIILPKKSYCPWNKNNVERVLRDERQHAEAQEREESLRDQESSRARLQTLRERKESQGGAAESRLDDKIVQAQHVNLFSVEEEEHRKRAENATAIDSRKGKRTNSGIMPLYLGHSARKDSFYLKTGDHLPKDQNERSNPKEDRLKSRMDPMKEFVARGEPTSRVASPSEQPSKEPATATQPSSSIRKHRRHRRSSERNLDPSSDSDSSSSASSLEDSDSRERRRRRRRKRRKHSSQKQGSREKKSKVNDSRNSLDELRRRRAEREEKERNRQERVIASSERHKHARYQDQYHPGLSRN